MKKLINIHWLIKYYLIAFISIFSIAYFIETSEPKVNWLLYNNDLENIVKSAILDSDCAILKKEYNKEIKENYRKNILGINVRKDNKSIKGLNLLSYLKHHMQSINCSLS